MENPSVSEPRSRGFTLIELLIVVAIIGIISAIAIPNMFSALQKARQKRTMADMRVLAETLEIYSMDISAYPKVGDGFAEDLIDHLTPYIAQIVPTRDGWGKAMIYRDEDGEGYTLFSLGANFVEDKPHVYGPTQRFRDDILISRGTFIQWPDGAQSN